MELSSEIVELADEIRHQPYRFFRRNCLHKSWDFVRECHRRGIAARMVVCLGIVYPRLGRWRFPLLGVHSWGEAEGERVEVSHPPEEAGVLGIRVEEIRPLVEFRLI